MAFHHYKSISKTNARTLRNNSTKSEVYMWMLLRKKQLGCRFIRQYTIKNYILDFYCKDLKLAIEIDGDYHYDNSEKDLVRQETIEKNGIRFLRIRAEDVEKNPDGVGLWIQNWIKENYK